MIQQPIPHEAKLSLASMVGIFLAEVANILTAYPLVSYCLMAAFGAVAAHLIDVEKQETEPKDFRTFSARFFVTIFAAVLVYFGWSQAGWPIPLGLLVCGVISVWPRQMLQFAFDTVKKIIGKRIDDRS